MAELIADPDFAYGSVGLEESGIPANAAVTVTVELVTVQVRYSKAFQNESTVNTFKIPKFLDEV